MKLFHIKFCILCSISLLLSACLIANGPLEYASNKDSEKIRYLPIWLPYILGGHGSSVPITDELSLTAKHVAMIDYSSVIAYHPECDIAIIKQNNKSKHKAVLGSVSTTQKLNTLGWGFLGRVLKGEGKYYMDVNIAGNSYFDTCPASITDASVQSGMSGGGVFNQQHELVGIIVGLAGSDFRLLSGEKLNNPRTSFFVATFYLKDWIFEVTRDYYQKPIKQTPLKYHF